MAATSCGRPRCWRGSDFRDRATDARKRVESSGPSESRVVKWNVSRIQETSTHRAHMKRKVSGAGCKVGQAGRVADDAFETTTIRVVSKLGGSPASGVRDRSTEVPPQISDHQMRRVLRRATAESTVKRAMILSITLGSIHDRPVREKQQWYQSASSQRQP